MAKAPLRLRLAKAILGSHAKDYIPPLMPNFGFGEDGSRIKTYSDKISQIQENVNWCYAANDAITQDCMAVELMMERRQKDGSWKDVTEENDDRANQVMHLLANPNNAHSGEDLTELHFSYMNFNGEAYTMMIYNGNPWIPEPGKLPDALQEIPAHMVQFQLKRFYSDSTIRFNGDEFRLGEFIRSIKPNPSNPYLGLSIISAAAAVINSDREMRLWNNELLANGAKPSIIYTTAESMDDDVYQRFIQQFESEHTGSQNAGKPLLIEGGDARPYMLSPQDLDFIASRDFTMKEILAMWKVSPYKLGMVDDINRASAIIFDRKHAKDNIVPRMRKWVRQLNVTMVEVFDPDLRLAFRNPVPEDIEQDIASKVAGVNKWITIDEAREDDGMTPLPNGLGGQLYIPTTNAPLAAIADGSARPAAPGKPGEGGNIDGDGEEDESSTGTNDDAKDPKGKKSLDG